MPTIRLEGLTPAQVRAYIIADNRLAEDAGWDNDILKIELQHLSIELGMDLSLTGFEVAEIDLILRDGSEEEGADDALPGPDVPRVVELGDLWQLGKHRILCADALDPSSYERLLDGKLAATVFIDPPYNVRIDGHASGKGATHHRDFAMASGALLDCTRRGDLVLDSFLGSGSTLMAAERVGRVCHGIEIDPMYVDVALTRWQNATGRDAVNVASGLTYKKACEMKEVENVQ